MTSKPPSQPSAEEPTSGRVCSACGNRPEGRCPASENTLHVLPVEGGLSVNDTVSEGDWCECPATNRRHFRREGVCPVKEGRSPSPDVTVCRCGMTLPGKAGGEHLTCVETLPEPGRGLSRSGGTMLVRRWRDDATLTDRIVAENVSPEETFSQDLLDTADPQYLAYDGETITLTVDNGKWIWRVVEVDPVAKTVLGRWPD